MEPVHTQFVTHSGYCRHCCKRVRSRHADQTSNATGAAGTQIGANALAPAADMKHRLGWSFRKITELFGSHFGLSVCTGTLVRAGQRLARFATGTYQTLITIIKSSPVVYGDETGWRISARSKITWSIPAAILWSNWFGIHPAMKSVVFHAVAAAIACSKLLTD